MWPELAFWLAMAGMLLLNALGVVLVALQLPGTWLIIVATAGFAWWTGAGWGAGVIGWEVILALVVLAVIGELLEFAAGTAGGLIAGSTKWGAFAAMVGGIVGAMAGTVLIPIPLVGTLVGAVAGAGLGSLLMDLKQGRTFSEAARGGGGAAVGRFGGAVGKLGVALVMWLLVVVALIWP